MGVMGIMSPQVQYRIFGAEDAECAEEEQMATTTDPFWGITSAFLRSEKSWSSYLPGQVRADSMCQPWIQAGASLTASSGPQVPAK